MNSHAGPRDFVKLLEDLGEEAWQLNLATNVFYVSPGFWKALGYDNGSPPVTREAARGLLHPSDLQLAIDEVALHLRAEAPFEFEVRVCGGEGDWRFIRVRGCISESSRGGRPAAVGGILSDVTRHLVTARANSQAAAKVDTLSKRERQVLSCILAGAASKNIAYGLGLSQRTVEGYRARILDKLGVRGTGELVKIALAGGIEPELGAACGLTFPAASQVNH